MRMDDPISGVYAGVVGAWKEGVIEVESVVGPKNLPKCPSLLQSGSKRSFL